MFLPFIPFLKPFCLIVPQPSICHLSTAAVTLLLHPALHLHPPPPPATAMLHSSFFVYSGPDIFERCTLQHEWSFGPALFCFWFFWLQFCFSVISTASYWFFVNNWFNIDFSKALGRSSNTHSQTPETLPYVLLCFFSVLFCSCSIFFIGLDIRCKQSF